MDLHCVSLPREVMNFHGRLAAEHSTLKAAAAAGGPLGGGRGGGGGRFPAAVRIECRPAAADIAVTVAVA